MSPTVENHLAACTTLLRFLGHAEAVQVQFGSDGTKPHIEVLAAVGADQYVGGTGETLHEALTMLLGVLNERARQQFLALAVLFGDAMATSVPLTEVPRLRIVPKVVT